MFTEWFFTGFLLLLPCCMCFHMWLFYVKNNSRMEEEYKERMEVKRIEKIINRERKTPINIPNDLHW
jgi:hypothetical protein